ncbi:hypothetical protein DC522_05875 [Microvirga sp. KLBC 81]|uniref:hypothetical protein n=1 Tax=Microvirga sp. KLBC 81 TaxID=1862707 RepID=UPI000D5236B3|nr:hypothetical protein [Microvirga sp. KLBC 81]PVE25422.1 hypothetical protein DC522_05875 [Microvirga sp. KLBC 81]
MRTVPLEHGEICRPFRWKQFIVLHPAKQPAILCLHSRVKARLKEWRHPSAPLVEQAKLARVEDPDADFVAAVVRTIS